MGKLKRVFTEDEISQIMYEGGIYDADENELFNVVHEEVVDTDIEKSSVDVEFVIEEVATGKFYKARLMQSQWCRQAEYNAKQAWYEVAPRKIITVVYDKI